MKTSEIRLLRAFPILMRERSVSRAAFVLGLSQPAMSHLLGRLRELLADPLLLQTRTGMVPTQRAVEIEPSIQTLLDDYDRLTLPPGPFSPAASTRTFNISAPEFAERVLIPPLIRKIRSEAPGVRLVVHAPHSDRSFELLERGELDLRLAWLIPAPVASLRSLRLFQDRLVCVADKHNPAIRGPLTLENYFSLPHLRTVGYSQTTTGRAIDDAIRKQGRELRHTQTVQTFLTMMHSLAGTDLIATVPRMIAKEFEPRLGLQILEPPLQLPDIRYCAYWHERKQSDAGHRWFRSALANVGRSLAV